MIGFGPGAGVRGASAGLHSALSVCQLQAVSATHEAASVWALHWTAASGFFSPQPKRDRVKTTIASSGLIMSPLLALAGRGSSELRVQTHSEHRDRSTIEVVGRINDKLIVGADPVTLCNR